MRFEFIALLCAIAAGGYALRKLLRRVTIYEYERGLKYRDGAYAGILEAGVFWINTLRTDIRKIDVRSRILTVPSQEILTRDGVAIKLSMAAEMQIEDVARAFNASRDYEESVYTSIQLALRQVIGGCDIDDLLASREQIGPQVLALVQADLPATGVRMDRLSLKDITFPGALKQTFAQVARARHEGLAALERARGESAALRNLANSAKMLEKNPALVQLRMLQALGESNGNTLVLNVTPELTSSASSASAAHASRPEG